MPNIQNQLQKIDAAEAAIIEAFKDNTDRKMVDEFMTRFYTVASDRLFDMVGTCHQLDSDGYCYKKLGELAEKRRQIYKQQMSIVKRAANE